MSVSPVLEEMPALSAKSVLRNQGVFVLGPRAPVEGIIFESRPLRWKRLTYVRRFCLGSRAPVEGMIFDESSPRYAALWKIKKTGRLTDQS